MVIKTINNEVINRENYFINFKYTMLVIKLIKIKAKYSTVFSKMSYLIKILVNQLPQSISQY